jgi:hypothetical protein
MNHQRVRNALYTRARYQGGERVGARDQSAPTDVQQAQLVTGHVTELHPASLASARDALAAHRAAERAIVEHGGHAAIRPDDFRSIAPPGSVGTAADVDTDAGAQS